LLVLCDVKEAASLHTDLGMDSQEREHPIQDLFTRIGGEIRKRLEQTNLAP
jgi:hypothetical protein